MSWDWCFISTSSCCQHSLNYNKAAHSNQKCLVCCLKRTLRIRICSLIKFVHRQMSGTCFCMDTTLISNLCCLAQCLRGKAAKIMIKHDHNQPQHIRIISMGPYHKWAEKVIWNRQVILRWLIYICVNSRSQIIRMSSSYFYFLMM